MIPLQMPDFQILKWGGREGGSEALVLGADLEKGHSLYRDLQRKYFTQRSDMEKGAEKDLAEAMDDPEKHDLAEEGSGCKIAKDSPD